MFEEGTMINEEEADVIMSNTFKKIMNQMSKLQITVNKRPLMYIVSDEEDNKDQDNQDMDDDNNEIYQQSIEDIIENVDYDDGKNQKQSIKDTIKRIDQYIKNEKLSKTELARYQSVVWYLHLLQNGKKIESSETVAAICNK
ncbi:25856_t:CDS:2, partial [Racocetra persica]